jgi:hypothetical protein
MIEHCGLLLSANISFKLKHPAQVVLESTLIVAIDHPDNLNLVL